MAQVKDILVEESNVQPVNSPVAVCGDIHGQFHDLMKLFETGGHVPSTNYIFMVLCVHGGLSPDIRTLDQVRRPTPPATYLMWSDPEDIDTWAVSPRGAGWLFGSRVTSEFNHINGLELVCRAHQLVQEGLKYMFPDRGLVTVWSAPNYCYRCGNMASILLFDENMEREVKYFSETEENNTMMAPRAAVPYFL
eukprot:jgi/Mesen1/6628/ME000034S06084